MSELLQFGHLRQKYTSITADSRQVQVGSLFLACLSLIHILNHNIGIRRILRYCQHP